MATDVEAAIRSLTASSPDPPFDPAELDDLPAPVRRFLGATLAVGVPVTPSVTLEMRGRLKVGRWLPFRATEVLAPHEGFVWRARAAGVISGHDLYLDGRGAMEWRLLGLVPVVTAEGADTSTSAAGRCGGEAIWAPTALLPRHGVEWAAEGDDHVVAAFAVGSTPVEIHLHLRPDGLARSVVFDRWGDPDGSGTFGWHPFGGDITAHRTFSGLTIPSEGTWGWGWGTDRWESGRFFEARLTGLVPGARAAG